nr:MAG TPA: hypothetical protein [Caudoviricetes sp.]
MNLIIYSSLSLALSETVGLSVCCPAQLVCIITYVIILCKYYLVFSIIFFSFSPDLYRAFFYICCLCKECRIWVATVVPKVG